MVKIKVDYIANHKLHKMTIDFPLDDKVEKFCIKLQRRKDVVKVEIMEEQDEKV